MKQSLISYNTAVVDILDLISQPAAPFHESRVVTAIRSIVAARFSDERVRLTQDRFGNLLLSFWNAEHPSIPSLTMASHLDHPGFEVSAVQGRSVRAIILGGLPRGEPLLGSPVALFSADAEYKGRILEFHKGHDNDDAVSIELDEKLPSGEVLVFGVPDIERFAIDPPYLRGRAMDDLVGCAIQIAVFERVVNMNIPVDCMAFFSRAEEVGFIGAQAACELRTVPPETIVVSLEASKNIHGARPGLGVVIRTGDRLYIFDQNAQKLLDSAAQSCGESGVNHQKKRMDGGACEASLYMAHGYHATAMAVPLIHYHNHGNGKIEPEIIHIYDVNSGVEILTEAIKQLPDFKLASRISFIEGRRKKFLEAIPKLLPQIKVTNEG